MLYVCGISSMFMFRQSIFHSRHALNKTDRKLNIYKLDTFRSLELCCDVARVAFTATYQRRVSYSSNHMTPLRGVTCAGVPCILGGGHTLHPGSCGGGLALFLWPLFVCLFVCLPPMWWKAVSLSARPIYRLRDESFK